MAHRCCCADILKHILPTAPRFVNTRNVTADEWMTGYGIRIKVIDLTDDHLANILDWLEEFIAEHEGREDLRWQAGLTLVQSGKASNPVHLVREDTPMAEVWAVFFPSLPNLLAEATKRNIAPIPTSLRRLATQIG